MKMSVFTSSGSCILGITIWGILVPVVNKGSVVTNFMCQPDWVTEYPDIRLNIISERICEDVSRWD